MKVSSHICLALLLLSLTGCGVAECIDAQFPRQSTPLPGAHVFEIAYKKQPPVTVKIVCERYYDAMCAERGNFWAVREIGSTQLPNEVMYVSIKDERLGEIRFFRPSCELLRKPAPTTFNESVSINGDTYFYTSQNEQGYVFTKKIYALEKVDPGTAVNVVLPFVAKIDGRILAPPLPRQN